MKYFKIAYDIFVHRFLFSIILIIEIAAMLILINVVICSYNTKKMLYQPYEEILKNDGVILDIGNLFMREYWNEDIENILENDSMDYNRVVDYIEKNTEGDTKVFYNRTMTFDGDKYGPKTLMYDDNGTTHYILLNDKIFDSFRLPLREGRWASSNKNENGEIEIVVSGGIDTKLNAVYSTPVGKLRVVGILTDPTYTPFGASIDMELSEKKEKYSMYTYLATFDQNVNTSGAFIIADEKLFPKNSGMDYYFDNGEYWMVSYGKGLSTEAIKKNTDFLKTIGEVRDICGDENFATISEQSEKYLNQVYLKMLPVIITVMVVVLAGLIGSIAISATKQIRKFAVFFLCGCRWKDCNKIIEAHMTIIIFLSVLFAVLGLVIMRILNMDVLIGVQYGVNNLVISLAMLLLMYLLAILIPHNIIKTSSPIEAINESD